MVAKKHIMLNILYVNLFLFRFLGLLVPPQGIRIINCNSGDRCEIIGVNLAIVFT